MAYLTRGERFKDARTVHNQHGKQTMKAVETATGVSASLIKDLEDDHSTRSVGYEKVAALAAHYGVSADYLLSLSDDPAIKPCAVDDLGLIPEVVEELDCIESEFGERYVETINCVLLRLLRSPIFEMVHSLFVSVQAEEDAPDNILPPEHRRMTSGASRTSEELSTSFILKTEILKAHPELKGRIHVMFGSMILKPQLDEICGLFQKIIEEITGYDRFLDE